jgi:hypothetical protein
MVIVRGAPKSFPSSDASHAMDLITIQKNAAAHGAKGVIIAVATLPRVLSCPIRVARGSYSVMDDKGAPVVSRSYYAGIALAGMIGYKTFKNW